MSDTPWRRPSAVVLCPEAQTTIKGAAMNRPIGRALRRLTLATTLIFFAGALVATAANAGTVLILDTSVTGGASSREAQAAIAAGHTVELATPLQWAAKTTADFATYDALILGDPTCGLPSTPYIGAAEANRTVWSPAIDGNIVVIGTDDLGGRVRRRCRGQDRSDGLPQLLLPRHRPADAGPRARPVRNRLQGLGRRLLQRRAHRRDASRARRPDGRVALQLVVLGARGDQRFPERLPAARDRGGRARARVDDVPRRL